MGAEIDNTLANTATINQRSLIVAQMLSGGTATPNFPFLASGSAAVAAACGVGSMASYMHDYYRKIDSLGELWILPVSDNAGGAAATMTVTVSGTATSAGTLNLYVIGDNQTVGVAVGDTASVIAANIVSAINLGAPLPVTASASAGVVTITARHKGAAAGDIDVRLNYRGPTSGEVTPTGITVAIAAGTVGATDPVLDTALANLGGQQPYDFIISAYAGSAQVLSLQNLFSDTNGRWSYLSELFGGAFNASKAASLGALQTYGTSNNNQHISTIGVVDVPEPAYIWATGYGAVCASSLRVDPAMPLQYIALPMLPPPVSSRLSQSSRNTLLYSGISTFFVNNANQVVLERSISTYQTNLAGVADNSYLDTETLFTLAYVVRDLRQDLISKFARKKLVADGTNVPYGSNFVTSQTILREAIAHYRRMSSLGYTQSPDVYAKTAAAENQGNGRVALALPIMVANQLRRIDLAIAFTKP